jgi:very-short-patch-repair endonuclease
LLQENGYFVLRFLAEDVGKELDAVLDAVLRVLARRRQARAEPLKFVLRGGE